MKEIIKLSCALGDVSSRVKLKASALALGSLSGGVGPVCWERLDSTDSIAISPSDGTSVGTDDGA